MSESPDDIQKKLEEVNALLGRVKVIENPEMSVETLHEFCYRFDQFVFGSIEFLRKETKSHNLIILSANGEQVSEYPNLVLEENYSSLVEEIKRMTPPTRIDFSFNLLDSFYPIGDISECVTVYFYKDRYVITYLEGNDSELRFTMQYNTHISPDEILNLRDKITMTILNKIAGRLEKI